MMMPCCGLGVDTHAVTPIVPPGALNVQPDRSPVAKLPLGTMLGPACRAQGFQSCSPVGPLIPRTLLHWQTASTTKLTSAALRIEHTLEMI